MKRRGFLGLFGAALLAPFVPPVPGELAGATTTISSFDGLLREYYSEPAVSALVYDTTSTFFSMLKKSEVLT